MTSVTNTNLGTSSLNNSNTETGDWNTAIGAYTLMNNTTGTNNVALGGNSLLSNSTGNYNTGLGTASLVNNIQGFSNTSIGAGSMSGNVSGNRNTGVGVQTLENSSSGNNNTAVGTYALLGTEGNDNVAIGAYALTTNDDGVGNTAVGTNSLKTSLDASNNTAVGYNACALTTTGTLNSCLGSGALGSNTSGSYNTAVGSNSLTNNTTVSSNTAFGANALYSNKSGTPNTAVGVGASYTNTTGSNNTSVGANACYFGNGSYNTGVGNSAMKTLTSGGSNTAVGAEALFANGSGSNNTAVGLNAMYANTSSYNTGVGNGAGQYDVGGSSNTYLGYAAGQANGDLNVYINSTAIGANSVVTKSNQMVLGTSFETVYVPGTLSLESSTAVSYPISSQPSVTVLTAASTVLPDDILDNSIIQLNTGSSAVTLPDPATRPGLVLNIYNNNGKSNNITAQNGANFRVPANALASNFMTVTSPWANYTFQALDSVWALMSSNTNENAGVYMLNGSATDFTSFPILYSTPDLSNVFQQPYTSGLTNSPADDTIPAAGSWGVKNMNNQSNGWVVHNGYGLVGYADVSYGGAVIINFKNTTSNPVTVFGSSSLSIDSVKIYYSDTEVTNAVG